MERRSKTIFVMMLIIMYFGGGLADTFGAEITLRYAGNLPLNHHVTKGQELFAKMIEERTNGQVKVKVYGAGQLFSDKDMMKALPAGAVEMAAVTLSQWTGLVPGLLFLDLPFFFRDQSHMWSMLDGKVGEMLSKDLEAVGAKLLYWVDCGSFDFASKEPIRVLEDFNGKRIRVIGEMASESIKALGAAPAFMGGGEMYMALQRGTVDGANTLVASFCERKFYEVTKHVTNSGYAFATVGALMNLKKWNELPSDIQKIILDCSVEAQRWSREAAQKMDRECLGSLSGKGMEIYTLPEKERERWEKAVKPAIDIFLKRTGEKGKELMKIAEKVH